MKVTVLGANGKTGVEVVKQALAAGHTVNALVRSTPQSEQKNLNVFIGDATDVKTVADASKGSDVIISTLGTNSNKSTLMTDAIAAVLVASKATGVRRFILMSSFAVHPDRLKGGAKLMMKILSGMTKDKTNSENMIRKSTLDWTIVYPTILTNQPKGSGLRVVSESEKIGMKNKIARADVAAWMVHEAEKNEFVRADVTLSK